MKSKLRVLLGLAVGMVALLTGAFAEETTTAAAVTTGTSVKQELHADRQALKEKRSQMHAAGKAARSEEKQMRERAIPGSTA